MASSCRVGALPQMIDFEDHGGVNPAHTVGGGQRAGPRKTAG